MLVAKLQTTPNLESSYLIDAIVRLGARNTYVIHYPLVNVHAPVTRLYLHRLHVFLIASSTDAPVLIMTVNS